MLGIHDLQLFLAAGLLLNLTPGPDMLLVAARSGAQGRRAGLLAALGVGVGCLVHVALASVGLTALLSASETAYTLVKYLGAAYLIWLGASALLASTRPAPTAAAIRQPAGSRSAFWQGVLTNALNPKVALFFLAFLPQFVDTAAPGHALGLAALGLVFTLNGTLVNLGVALLSHGLARKLQHAPGAQRLAAYASRAVGLVFIGLGLRLALSSR